MKAKVQAFLPGTCEFAKELELAIPELSSLAGGVVVSRKEIAVVSSVAGRRTQARGRLELLAAAASLGFYVFSGISTPAAASHLRHYRTYPLGALGSEPRGWHRSHRLGGRAETTQSGKPEPPKQPSGPLILAISISSQRVTVYDNGTPIAVSQVSTGMAGHPTPMGVFSVIQKQRWHHSNIYSGAPMPYMQRITWSGVAMHAGVVPGHPASHGCIRLPERFAVRLWGMTKVGARVIIARGDEAPYEITHPRLTALVKPSEAAVGTSAAQNVRSSAEAAPREIAAGAVRVAASGAGTASGAEAGQSAPSGAAVGASESPQVGDGATEDKPVEPGQTAEPKTVEPAPPSKLDEALQHPGPISLFVSRKLGKVFVRKGFAPVLDAPVTIARPEEPLGTHIFTASRPTNEDGGVRWLAVSIGYDRAASRPAPKKRRGHTASDERPAPLTRDGSRQAAVDALDRIEFPPEVLERIVPLIAPGASLLIADQGLGDETGRDTDFIVVTK